MDEPIIDISHVTEELNASISAQFLKEGISIIIKRVRILEHEDWSGPFIGIEFVLDGHKGKIKMPISDENNENPDFPIFDFIAQRLIFEIRRLTIIKKGSFFVVTSGEYDDYSMDGMYRAKEDIDLDGLKETYKQANFGCFDFHKFLEWFWSLGMAVEVEFKQLYLDYREDSFRIFSHKL